MGTLETRRDSYGKYHVVCGYRGVARMYVHHKPGKRWGYYVTPSIQVVSTDELVEIGGEYWFSTLAELKAALLKG